MEDIVPRLAIALGQLHRAPDRNAGWVDHVLRALERERPDDHARLRRRLGFARPLAHLLGLSGEDTAAMVVGLFFAGLVDGSVSGDVDSAPRRWMEYLLRNDGWLAPSLRLVEALEDSEPSDSLAVELAKAVVTFDQETSTHSSRSPQVLRSMRDKACTPEEQRVIQLLWSEEGQELCAHHVREGGQQYALEPAGIKEDLNLLEPAPAPIPVEPVLAPTRLTGLASGSRGDESDPPGSPDSGTAALASETFERRKRALRSSLAGRSRVGEPEPGGTHQITTVPEPAGEAPAPRSSTAAADVGPVPRPPPLLKEAGHPGIGAQRSPEPSGDLKPSARLEELRMQLRQIEEGAVRGRELLAALAKDLERLSTEAAESASPANPSQRPEGGDQDAA